ncbi:MAG: DUF1203 domain-containing protein [Hyphomonadaceae bacterium]|nr:MAG: hypothetical protein FD160_2260 [Caulobacteraceae bacterium]MBT9446142.1 DUF1203 domain-containing protein [Hyphomonadaceae bacterium]TPW04401.1 MAG: hypothetical protein FD124_2613 [Alphaproteobacteria bacterium]
MTAFIVHPLDPQAAVAAAARFEQNDPEVRLVEVTAPVGFPCRVTLGWAKPGEKVLLFKHNPFDAASPYAEQGPVFARRSADASVLAANETPAYIADVPLIVVRGYDDTTSIVHADVAPGRDCATAIRRAFENDAVEYVHVRAAAYGCFQFRVDRV